jgi:hypothetical protein
VLIDEAQSRRRDDADKPSIRQRTVYETGMINANPYAALASPCRAASDRINYFRIRNSLFQFPGYVGTAVILTMFFNDKQADETRVWGFAGPYMSPNPKLIGTTGCMRSEGIDDALVEQRRNQRQGIRRTS